MDENGNILDNDEEIASRWKQYRGRLYSWENLSDIIESEVEVDADSLGDSILKEEFELALTKLKNKKASGIDNIPIELLKAEGTKMKATSLTSCVTYMNKKNSPPISRKAL